MSDPTMGDYEVAEAVAPTWAQRAPMIEQICTPVREWLVRELRPSESDTVLELAAGVGDTGFDDVRTEEVALRFPIPSVEEYVAFVADTAGPLALVLRELPAAERSALQAGLEEAFEPFSAEGGFELPGVTLCAVAS